MRDTCGVRASGLQGDPPSEIIEIFDDDADGPDNRAPSHTTADQGGQRWIGPVAVLALVAVIGYGVASSASSTRAPKVETAPSTTLVPRSKVTVPVLVTPTNKTLPPAPVVPYYAASPPRQYKIQYVDIQSADGGVGAESRFQLWATKASISTPRSWFSIASFPGDAGLSVQNAYRLQTDHGVVAISHMPSGQSSAQYVSNSNWMLLTAFGFSDDDLVRLAGSITFDDTGGGTFFFAEPALTVGYDLISTMDPWAAVMGQPPEQVFYGAAGDPFGGFNISVAPLLLSANRDFSLDRQSALQFLINNVSPFTVDGNDATAGELITQPGFALASWSAGNHIVTLSGKMSVPDLIAIAQTVHQVSAEEWAGMQFQAIHNASENHTNNTSAVNAPQPVPVSFGTDSQATPWTIRAALYTYDNLQQINWDWPDGSFATTPTDTAQINTLVDDKRTYVLADLPRATATTAELHVTPAGLDPVVIKFNDIDPTLDRTFAAYAFSEPGPYTAQVVGADGTVLATWPSP
jgi:hypothetical protein